MTKINRRNFIGAGFASVYALHPFRRANAQTNSLQDVGGLAISAPTAKIFTAREIVTLDPARSTAEAIAVVNGRILWVGTLDETIRVVGAQPYEIDKTFADQVIVPGFVAQHDHPVLAALTMSSEILSIEDWVLPSGTVPAVKDKQDFMKRLAKAVAARTNPEEPVVSWGYHRAFFGPLTRSDLDSISKSRPIVVWGRSCHEMFLNSASMQRGKLTEEAFSAFSPSAKRQSNFEEGHFWEQALFAILPYVATMVASPQRLQAGLELSRDYMHAKGVTIGNEPGGILAKQVQDGVNAVFSSPDMPFRWSFMVDGKSMVAKYPNDADVIAESEKLASWYGGMTSLAPKQAKLFADGAIYSLLMQVRHPYLDGHKGEWMMDHDVFERAFRVYWDSKAAVRLRIAQPALSRHIRDLEAELGLLLFERMGRRLILTAEGEQLLKECRSLLAYVAEIGERAQLLRRGDGGGVLKIAASPQHIESVLSRLLPRFVKQHPGVSVRLIEAVGHENLAMLERGEVHLGQNLLQAVSPGDKRFGRRDRGLVELLAVSHSTITSGRRTAIDISDLAVHRLLLLSTDFSIRRTFDAACRLAGVVPDIQFESRAPHTVLALAQAGEGVAIIPSGLQTDRYRLRVARVTYRDKPITEQMTVFWDKRRPLPPYASSFCDLWSEFVRKVFPITRPTRFGTK